MREDIGETNDLAAQKSELVKELNVLIERFLLATKAVVPVANLAFDPALYRVELEGKPASRSTNKASANGPRETAAAKPVAGWNPSKDCLLKIEQGALVINSTGADPYISFALPKVLPAGEYQLELVMTSRGGGRGQFFWQEQGVQPPFFRDRSVGFNVTHDGQSQTYRIAFTPSRPITAVRLDPGQAAGEIRVTGMRLLDSSGASVYPWRFGDE